MAPLHEDLRRGLERAVVQAREIAERGAEAALDRLAVSAREPHSHLSVDERVLRNRLRARARALGDTLRANGVQDTERLAEEVAYEVWHRMLFARFLAENQLLVHPEHWIPVSLAECAELALEEGAEDRWVLAARYAARMLPQIFRPDDPALLISFAPEHRVALERVLEELPAEVFRADDSLGWVYQFWQAKRKKEVNDAGEPITGETLPAVTQLFTEPYMVSFLLENTVGAWWSARHPGEALPVEMPYLRRLEDGAPAAGAFEGWPTEWREFTMLDPCCGSGHFLVAALRLIVPLRMHDDGLSVVDAVDAVLRDNLYGLELDPRCTQIAAFAVALAAWTTPGAAGFRPLPELQIACSGLAIGAKRTEWLALAEGRAKLQGALGRLYDLFKQAPELGSLVDPTADREDLLTASFSDVKPLLEQALASERAKHDEQLEATAVVAQGIARAADLLGREYTLVATNVPYLGQRRQGTVMRRFCESYYARSKADLAAVFIERSLRLAPRGSLSLVTPVAWLDKAYYVSLREHFIESVVLNCIGRLGTGAFRTISGEVVDPALVIMSSAFPSPTSRIAFLDVGSNESAQDKASALQAEPLMLANQFKQRNNPGARISASRIDTGSYLSEYVDVPQGIKTGDDEKWVRAFWELTAGAAGWERSQGATERTCLYGGRQLLIDWRTGGRGMVRPRLGSVALGKRGVAINQTGARRATLYTGSRFDSSTAPLVPKSQEHLAALWVFCTSEDYTRAVDALNPGLFSTNSTLVQVPFDLEHWTAVARERLPGGIPEPHVTEPTQWLFRAEVVSSTAPLQVAVARLLGYQWPDQPNCLSIDALADADGIVCFPAVRGEVPAAERVNAILAAAYGKNWSPITRDELLAANGFEGRTLEHWLQDGFFEQHCKLFHHRPFIWHITDRAKDGFSALVNYHKLDRKTLEALTYTYLGDWINRQEEAKKRDERGADVRLAKAKELQEKLRLILEGEPPYDIFVRWKPLHEQPIGWEPDLNDGVRVNIWPFVQAGILRSKVNVHWKKDRGKNPAGSSWGEDRYNRYEDIPRDARPAELRDVEHLTNDVKREARKAHESGARPAAPRKLATSRR